MKENVELKSISVLYFALQRNCANSLFHEQFLILEMRRVRHIIYILYHYHKNEKNKHWISYPFDRFLVPTLACLQIYKRTVLN